jgi:hypothetical protein
MNFHQRNNNCTNVYNNLSKNKKGLFDNLSTWLITSFTIFLFFLTWFIGHIQFGLWFFGIK